MSRNHYPSFGSHQSLLVAIALRGGNILELGCGYYSTPVLHEIVHGLNLYTGSKSKLVTVETDPEWIKLFENLKSDSHDFILSKESEIANLKFDVHWSLVFVDHKPGPDRVVSIRNFKDADILCVHDTQEPSYGWEPTLSEFKYSKYTVSGNVGTTILSNSVNLSFLDSYPHM